MKNYYLLFLLFTACYSGSLQAQCLLPCGTGANGVVTYGASMSIAAGTYNYVSFNINPGVTLDVVGVGPLIIHCTGSVNINGTLTASGHDGTNGITYTSAGVGGSGVAGGGNGGNGTFSVAGGPITAFSGTGLGAGGFGSSWSGGGGAGYSAIGGTAGPGVGLGGPMYGTPDIVTLDAGSGGGGGSGGSNCGAGGGGGGGGMIQISSCDSIYIGPAGAIMANGGNGGSDGTGNCGGGGGGSGGSVWLSAPGIINIGAIQATGGIGGASNIPGSPYYGTGANGADGRVRIDYTKMHGNGPITPAIGFSNHLAATVTDSNVTCNGAADGFASVTPTAGQSPFTYLWSNAITDSLTTGLTPGTYNILVTDNAGCQFTDTLVITEPPAITATSTDSNVTCNGGSNGGITITPGVGFVPFTYLWSNAVTDSANTGLTAGPYSVIVTDAMGCEYLDTITITEPPALTLVMGHTDKTTAVNNGTATATAGGGTPVYTYLWSPGGGTTATITGLGAGIYTVVVTDANGCTKTDTVTVHNTFLAVGAQTLLSGMSVFPNPANDILNIQMDLQQATDISIILMDFTGRVLETNSYKAIGPHAVYQLNMSNYANGNYFLKIRAGDQVQNVPVSILR